MSTKHPAVRPMFIDWDNLQVAPWEKLPKESPRAFEAFKVYRDMPASQRAMTKTAEVMGRNPSTIRDFSVRWHWARRIDAWERYLDAIARQTQIEAIEEMNERHARTAMVILSKVGQRLVGDESAGVKPIDVNSLSANDLARLTEVATKIERLARGEQSESIGLHKEEEVRIKLAFDTEPIYPQVEAAVDENVVEADWADASPIALDGGREAT